MHPEGLEPPTLGFEDRLNLMCDRLIQVLPQCVRLCHDATRSESVWHQPITADPVSKRPVVPSRAAS